MREDWKRNCIGYHYTNVSNRYTLSVTWAHWSSFTWSPFCHAPISCLFERSWDFREQDHWLSSWHCNGSFAMQILSDIIETVWPINLQSAFIHYKLSPKTCCFPFNFSNFNSLKQRLISYVTAYKHTTWNADTLTHTHTHTFSSV